MKYYVYVDEFNSVTCWFKDAAMDISHRENGPAVENIDGYKAWYINGELHREDGPAVEYPSGAKYWYLNGVEFTEEEFNKKMNRVVEMTVADIEKLVGKKVKIVK